MPLHLQARWAHDECSLDKPPGAELLQDQSSLDGLSEAHLVGKDHACLPLLDHRPDDRHLMGLWLDPSVGQASEGIEPLDMPKEHGLKAKPERLSVVPRASSTIHIPTGPQKVLDELVDGAELGWDKVHEIDPLFAPRKHDLGDVAVQVSKDPQPTIRRSNAVSSLHLNSAMV